MLQALGRRRVAIIFVLVILNGLAALAYYYYLTPQRTESDTKLSAARSELEAKRAEIQKLKEEYVLLQGQLKIFKEMETKGFFNDQNRIEAQESFEKFRTISGILKASYQISAGQLVEDARAKQANYVVLRSPVKVELDSLDDVDVYSFIKLLQERFPGKVDIATLDLKRVEQVTPEVLQKIGTGDPVTMIKGSMEFDWRTMAPLAKIDPSSVQAVDAAGSTGAPQDPNAPVAAATSPAGTPAP